MTELPATEPEWASQPDLVLIAERLADVRALVRNISSEVGAGGLLGAQLVIERHRAEVYAAMDALGMAIYEFQQSDPPAERLQAAHSLVVGGLREDSLTSPVALFGAQEPPRRLTYFELVEHVRNRRPAGADVPARVLNDYYIHTRIGEAFLNRLRLFGQRLVEEVARWQSAGSRNTEVISLQYVGGDDLLLLAKDPSMLATLQVTSLDTVSAAVRHAERTLRPTFGSRIKFVMADPLRWLRTPACPSDSVAVVYAISLIEQLDTKSAVRLLNEVHRVLLPGGTLLMGSTPGNVPVGERMLRDWLLGQDWSYRSESEWREIFAQTPFAPYCTTFEYEPLGLNALIRAEAAC